uniref:Uncharacterized protein n=1 Tax=Arundo donax TaxID=35708 RepID=A0A0A9HGE1_ARUDO
MEELKHPACSYNQTKYKVQQDRWSPTIIYNQRIIHV